MADYLNPPSPERNRFSSYDLNALRKTLSPTERDYFFKTATETREAIASESQTKELKESGNRLDLSKQIVPDKNQTASFNRRTFSSSNELREELEKRVAGYLLSVVRERGVQSLESNSEGLNHAAKVAEIIKEGFAQSNLNSGSFKSSDECIAFVAGRLIGELPRALRDRRNSHDSKTLEIETDRETLSIANRLTSTEKRNTVEIIRDAVQPNVAPLIENQNAERTEKTLTNTSEKTIVPQTLTNALSQQQNSARQLRANEIASSTQTQEQTRRFIQRR